MKIEHYYAVIMAGGGGTRLWPLSRHDSPKQTLPIFEGKSLFQLAVERLQGYLPVNQIYVVTSADLMEQLHAQVPELLTAIFSRPDRVEQQPWSPGCRAILERDPNGVLAVLTADHLCLIKQNSRPSASRGELANRDIFYHGHQTCFAQPVMATLNAG